MLKQMQRALRSITLNIARSMKILELCKLNIELNRYIFISTLESRIVYFIIIHDNLISLKNFDRVILSIWDTFDDNTIIDRYQI